MVEQSQRREDFAKVKHFLVDDQEHQRADEDACIHVDGIADVLDVAVLLECVQLLFTGAVDALRVDGLLDAAFDRLDSFDHLGKELHTLVGQLLCEIHVSGDDIVGVVLQ